MAEGYTGGLHRVIFYGSYSNSIERMGPLDGLQDGSGVLSSANARVLGPWRAPSGLPRLLRLERSFRILPAASVGSSEQLYNARKGIK